MLPPSRAQETLRRHRPAAVARTARHADALLEMGAQGAMPAEVSGGEPIGLSERPPNDLAALCGKAAGERVAAAHVGPRVEQDAVGDLAVPARASHLLRVRLERAGEPRVDDEPHIRLVHAHPERHCSDDDSAPAGEEGVLHVGTAPGVKTGVVGQRVDAAPAQPRREGRGVRPRDAVYDAGIVLVGSQQCGDQDAIVGDPVLPRGGQAQVPAKNDPRYTNGSRSPSVDTMSVSTRRVAVAVTASSGTSGAIAARAAARVR